MKQHLEICGSQKEFSFNGPSANVEEKKAPLKTLKLSQRSKSNKSSESSQYQKHKSGMDQPSWNRSYSQLSNNQSQISNRSGLDENIRSHMNRRRNARRGGRSFLTRNSQIQYS